MNRLADRAWGRPNGPSAVASQPTTPLTLLLDAHEAARALRLSERTLWARTKAGEIPHVRIGRRVLYSPAALERWVAGLRIGPGAAAEKSSEGS